MPQDWLQGAAGGQRSTLHLSDRGRFTLFTGIGGVAWIDASNDASSLLGLDFVVQGIGRRQECVDHTGYWSRICEVADHGAVLAWHGGSVSAERVEALPAL